MTVRRCVLMVLLATAAMAFAPAPWPRPRRAAKAVARMEGTWQGESRILITSTHLTYHPNTTPIAYTLAIDTSVTPHAYDIRTKDKLDGWDYQGIWRVEGDTLTICYNHTSRGVGRPTGFEGPGKGVFTEVYKRVP